MPDHVTHVLHCYIFLIYFLEEVNFSKLEYMVLCNTNNVTLCFLTEVLRKNKRFIYLQYSLKLTF